MNWTLCMKERLFITVSAFAELNSSLHASREALVPGSLVINISDSSLLWDLPLGLHGSLELSSMTVDKSVLKFSYSFSSSLKITDYISKGCGHKIKTFSSFPSQNDVFHASNASFPPTVWGRGSDRSGKCGLGHRQARGPERDAVSLFAWPTPPGRIAANQREADGCWVGEHGACCDGETWITHRAEKLTISYLEICCYNSNP